MNGTIGAAEDFEPVPVSEYSEKTGPNTITFLSYQKYYKNSTGQLSLVDTNFVKSSHPDWDFEVAAGIWTLRVREDGTFQAEHEGNSFTYRLSGIGTGRGESFRSFDWGEANWKNYQVVGDTIRWSNVFPDADLSVRYIHDILKVDVIIKSNLMSRIRTEVLKGNLNADDYLTARFEIPNVWITTEAQIGGEKTDLYAETLDVDQPLEFVKNGKTVQKLRVVETSILDEKGNPMESDRAANKIRTGQVWRLDRNAAGIAEMSAHLGDLAQAPEGDVDIDPSMTFGTSWQDTLISNIEPNTIFGSNSTVNWRLGTNGGNTYDERLLLCFDVLNSIILYTTQISSATVKIYESAQSWSGTNHVQIH